MTDPTSFSPSTVEQEVLEKWKQEKTFEESQARAKDRPPFVFFDGPPFATGLPHYGHILAGAIKDVVCRYAHQSGYYVERRFGWDCHGLPIEFEIEKDLGLKSSHDVKAFGIGPYNDACRDIVMRCAAEWERIMTRMGRWIDFKNDYKTMNASYMESVWWAFKTLWDKGLVYYGFKVMPYSTGCTTPLSNFECNMNYKDVSDPALTVSFPLREDPNTRLLAWTTTPWTLVSNLALVVHPTMTYVRVADKKSGHKYILAECRLEAVYGPNKDKKDTSPPYEIEAKMTGSELVGLRYDPLFPFFESKSPHFFQVIADDYVTSDAGTGIVHSAPGFGEDDYRACLKNGVISQGYVVCPMDENGAFTAEVPTYKGRYVKSCDEDIAKAIASAGRLVQKSSIVHSYPFCWRSETPLLYRAIGAWFVAVERIKDQVLACNDKTHWVPSGIKTGRFTNWLQDARDWNISRNRYWGTPLPIWTSEDGEEVVCVGSIRELEELSGTTGLTDIHRQFIDDVCIPSKRPGKPPLRRVPQVFDCWFESGCMPYAQCHYPFEHSDKFPSMFPADFIAEGLDQTRGWFYTLMVLSSALMGSEPFKNVIVNGLVLAADGKKMSKRLKNYPDVEAIVATYGADALRLYLISSPTVRAEPLRFREEGVKEVVRDIFLPLYNVIKLFLSMLAVYRTRSASDVAIDDVSPNDMDIWIVSVSQSLVVYVGKEMLGYRLYTVIPAVLRFVESLTNWYVRMNRRRLKGMEGDADWRHALSTLLRVLNTISRVLAPFCPIIADYMYLQISPYLPPSQQEKSVHFLPHPDVEASRYDAAIEDRMAKMIRVIEMVRVLRDRIGIPMKMPIRSVLVLHTDPAFIDSLLTLKEYIRFETNAFDVQCAVDTGEYLDTTLDVNFPVVGKRLGSRLKAVRQALQSLTSEEIGAFLRDGEIAVAGVSLATDDVRVQKTVKAGMTGYEANAEGRLAVLVDKRKDDELIDAWRAREFINRIQQLRKSSGMVITDQVDVFFECGDALRTSIEKRSEQVNASIHSSWTPLDRMEPNRTVRASCETEIGEWALKLVFCNPK